MSQLRSAVIFDHSSFLLNVTHPQNMYFIRSLFFCCSFTNTDETSGLDWSTRFEIIKGICSGLHYLHEECQATPTIHGDLKPANIFLDDNMMPKLADFGLSRLFGDKQTRACTTSCKETQ
jgi:serine/threonine protein kinase